VPSRIRSSLGLLSAPDDGCNYPSGESRDHEWNVFSVGNGGFMTIDSKNVVSAGLTLVIVGLAAWASTTLFKQPQQSERHGVVEIQSVDISPDTLASRPSTH